MAARARVVRNARVSLGMHIPTAYALYEANKTYLYIDWLSLSGIQHEFHDIYYLYFSL